MTENQKEEVNKGEISDGYHTFNELYEHRHALFCYAIRNGAFANTYAVLDHYEGWDLLVARTKDDDRQVSYHIPVSHRNLWRSYAPIKERSDWDGHTSNDVVNRLNQGRLDD